MRAILFVPILLACGGSQQATTVEAHRREAARESEAARNALESYDRSARTPEGEPSRVSRGAFSPSGEFAFPEKIYDPSEHRLLEAEKHSAHAEAHTRAAEALEHFVDAECKQLPPRTRASCPMLGPATGFSEVDRGMQVQFRAGVPVAAVVAHMRCHLAYAHAHGYSDACPLYMKGVRIEATADGKGVNIFTERAGDVAELRRRVRAQAAVGRPPTTL